MTDYQPKSDFLRTIMERGFFHQCTDLVGLDARLLAGTPVSAYIGFDATADSLHVGSLMQIMMLRWLQKCGHRPIVLMGGGTTKVGDPSGKDETRKLLSKKNIDSNIEGIRSIFDKYISFDNGSTGAIQLNNADWLDSLKYVEFLRDIGRHFTINRMMTMESVKARLDREQPLTFLEFNYMLLQSYDFLELHQREGCLMQIGGSDQWGNIVNGIDLIRRINGAQVFGLTSPLLTKADGSKMGKTASGAIWLNEDEDDDNDEDEIYEVALNTNKLSSYEFWQFWRNTMDEDVGRFLKLFTELPLDECERLSALQGEEINEAKIVLANEVCALCHGKDKTKKAEEEAKIIFEEKGVGGGTKVFRISLKGSREMIKTATGDEIPKFDISRENAIELVVNVRNEDGTQKIIANDRIVFLAQILVKIGFANSGKEAKRMIANGEIRMNNEIIKHPAFFIDVSTTKTTTFSLGKKQIALVDFHD